MEISAQEAMELAQRVEEACPGLEEGLGVPVGNVISVVIDQSSQVLAELDAAAKGGTAFNATVAVARMVNGALAHLGEALPTDRLETKLHRAGRVVGRFMADKFAEKIREQLPKARA